MTRHASVAVSPRVKGPATAPKAFLSLSRITGGEGETARKGEFYVKKILMIKCPSCTHTKKKFSIRIDMFYRPVTGGGLMCTCWDIRSVNFFCFLKTFILQLGKVEHLKLLQECYRIENHYYE